MFGTGPEMKLHRENKNIQKIIILLQVFTILQLL